MALTSIDSYLQLLPILRDAPAGLLRLTYDSSGDVLYVSIGEPQEADESDELEDDVIARYVNGEIVGYTILNASKRVA